MANEYANQKNEADIERARQDGAIKVNMNGTARNVNYNSKTANGGSLAPLVTGKSSGVIMSYNDSSLDKAKPGQA